MEELAKKLQTLELIDKLKQKINTLDLTDQEKELINNWYKAHAEFFSEFVIEVFNKFNVNFTFFLPKEILIKCKDNSMVDKISNISSDYVNFFTDVTYSYIGTDLYAIIRPKSTLEYKSKSLLKFLEQLNKHKIHYTLLYQL